MSVLSEAQCNALDSILATLMGSLLEKIGKIQDSYRSIFFIFLSSKASTCQH
jgi:hypothetical protein